MSDVYRRLIKHINHDQPGFYMLLDPDRTDIDRLVEIVGSAVISGVDGFLIGGSLLMTDKYEEFVSTVKRMSQEVPVILFPGNQMMVSKKADAILFMSLLSGRNPDFLIHQQVLAAPRIKAYQLETISTAYLLIESGSSTSVEYISNTKPIPASKPDIAVAHAMAAEMMGFKLIYLEAGSGAINPVPDAVIKAVSAHVSLPVIVGGGIRDAETARAKVNAGASMIVGGNVFENQPNSELLREIADAVHGV